MSRLPFAGPWPGTAAPADPLDAAAPPDRGATPPEALPFALVGPFRVD